MAQSKFSIFQNFKIIACLRLQLLLVLRGTTARWFRERGQLNLMNKGIIYNQSKNVKILMM